MFVNVERAIRKLSVREKRLRNKWLLICALTSSFLLIALYSNHRSVVNELEDRIVNDSVRIDSLRKAYAISEARVIMLGDTINRYKYTLDFLRVVQPDAASVFQSYYEDEENQ